MNIGQNLLDLVISNAGPLVIVALIIGALVLLFKHKITEFVGLLVLGIIAIGFIYNPWGIKDVLLNIFNTVSGASTSGS